MSDLTPQARHSVRIMVTFTSEEYQQLERRLGIETGSSDPATLFRGILRSELEETPTAKDICNG